MCDTGLAVRRVLQRSWLRPPEVDNDPLPPPIECPLGGLEDPKPPYLRQVLPGSLDVADVDPEHFGNPGGLA